MTANLQEEVRRTLVDRADEVEVPKLDQLAFQAQVRAARRGGRIRRAAWLGGGMGVVAAGVVVALAATSLVTDPDSPRVTDGPANFAVAGASTPPTLLVGDGTVIETEGGSTFTANVELGRLGPEVVSRTVKGLLIVDAQSSPVQIHVVQPSAGQPLTIGEPTPLAPAVDNLAVSSDGKTGAWFALVGQEAEFVLYDFAQGKELLTEPVGSGGPSRTIIAVDGNRALVAVGEQLEIWDGAGAHRALGLAMSDYQSVGDWNGSVLALPSADRSSTDVFSISDAKATPVASVPLGSGELSPAGDNIVGFTPYGIDGPHTPDQDPRYIEVRSADGSRRSSLTGLPKTVYQYVWLDNDTIALTGGPGVGTWPGALDTYTCELSNLTCTMIAQDGTGPNDRLPMLASARGM